MKSDLSLARVAVQTAAADEKRFVASKGVVNCFAYEDEEDMKRTKTRARTRTRARRRRRTTAL